MLSDDKQRALYDQYGEAGVKSAVGGGAGAYTAVTYILHCLITFSIIMFSHDFHTKTVL